MSDTVFECQRARMDTLDDFNLNNLKDMETETFHTPMKSDDAWSQPLGKRAIKRRRRKHADSSSGSNRSDFDVNSLEDFPPLDKTSSFGMTQQ